MLGAILLGAIRRIATVAVRRPSILLIVGLLIVDCVIIAPNGIIGLIKERRASSDLVAQPAVFALLYVLNVIPIYFLQQQGRSLMLFSLEAAVLGHPRLSGLDARPSAKPGSGHLPLVGAALNLLYLFQESLGLLPPANPRS